MQARCREKMQKRRDKILQMQQSLLEATETRTHKKLERAVDLASRATDALGKLTERHDLLKELYNVTELGLQLERKERRAAEDALEYSVTELGMLRRENRQLRAELAG